MRYTITNYSTEVVRVRAGRGLVTLVPNASVRASEIPNLQELMETPCIEVIQDGTILPKLCKEVKVIQTTVPTDSYNRETEQEDLIAEFITCNHTLSNVLGAEQKIISAEESKDSKDNVQSKPKKVKVKDEHIKKEITSSPKKKGRKKSK